MDAFCFHCFFLSITIAFTFIDQSINTHHPLEIYKEWIMMIMYRHFLTISKSNKKQLHQCSITYIYRQYHFHSIGHSLGKLLYGFHRSIDDLIHIQKWAQNSPWNNPQCNALQVIFSGDRSWSLLEKRKHNCHNIFNDRFVHFTFKIIIIYHRNLLSHLGSSPLHVPNSVQLRVLFPMR